MKILHVISYFSSEYGGSNKAAFELCQTLVGQGHEVDLYTTNIARNGIMDVPCNVPIVMKRVNVTFFGIQEPRRWYFTYNLARALRKNIPDYEIVHIHGIYTFPTAVTAYYCRKAGIPYIIRPHGTLSPFIRSKSRLLKTIYISLVGKKNLNNASAIHYTTQEEMELASFDLSIKTPGVVVPNGIEYQEYTLLPVRGSFRACHPDIKQKFIFLFISRLCFQKGLDLLVPAYAKVARQREDVHMVIAGPGENGYDRKVKQWVLDERIEDRVSLLGMVRGEEKLAIFRDADVFVLPSYMENFGIVVIEAMACGLPVLISNRVSIRNEILDKRAGIVVDCNVEALADAMLFMSENPSLCKDMGKNGKGLSEEYSWKKASERMVEVYKNILDRNQIL